MTNNTIAKWTTRQTIVSKILQRKLQIEQHVLRWSGRVGDSWSVVLYMASTSKLIVVLYQMILSSIAGIFAKRTIENGATIYSIKELCLVVWWLSSYYLKMIFPLKKSYIFGEYYVITVPCPTPTSFAYHCWCISQ